MNENDDDFGFEPECDHDDADLDILTGRLVCSCGFTKWLTSDEFSKEHQRRLDAEAAYEAYLAKCDEEGQRP